MPFLESLVLTFVTTRTTIHYSTWLRLMHFDMSPSSTFISAFPGLALIINLLGNAPLVFVWLALARNAERVREQTRDRSGNRVLGPNKCSHGNLGQTIY